MTTLAIVGAGTMGSGIAHVAAASGFDVVLYDVDESVLEKSIDRILSEVKKRIEKGDLSDQTSTDIISKIRTTTSFNDFSACEVVIEGAVEQLSVKQDIFRRLDDVCSPNTLLATNTSSLS